MSMVKCHVCGQSILNDDEYEVCPVCGWAADSIQAEYPDSTGENNISLNEAKARYAKYGTINRFKIEAMGGKV